MRKDVKKMMNDLVNAKDANEINLIKGKLSAIFLMDNKEKELALKREELRLRRDEFDLKKEQMAIDNANKVAELDLKKEELNLHKEDLSFRKNQNLIAAKNAVVQVITTAALSTAKLGVFSVLSLYMHHKENIDYQKESNFSKELRQGLLK